MYPPESDDIYIHFASDGGVTCDWGKCNTCPLVNNARDCAPAVTDLLTRYPNPTILTPDTHPEIFL